MFVPSRVTSFTALVLIASMAACGGSGAAPTGTGFSLVETSPAVPEADTLLPTPAIADGDLTTSVGVNLGYSLTVGGDTRLRDVGLGFAAPPLGMNTLLVWVDRGLPADVASAYGWSVYASADNASWTGVAVTSPVVFSTLQNRFEITTGPLQARYVKVVTRPLAVGVTTDSHFADVFVTELATAFVSPLAP